MEVTNLTDIHSHLIYDIDDGTKTMEESIELIKLLHQVGFNNLIITPHYIEKSKYSANNNEKLKKFNELKKAVKKEKIDINLYLGNEVFINNNMLEDIKVGEIYTLNNSKYLLFELPLHNQILNVTDVIYEIKLAGYIPVLAHPERYDYLYKKHSLIDSLKKEGILFQANFGSIIGLHGLKAKRLIKYLLKKDYIDFFGTDLHHLKKVEVLTDFPKIEKKIIKIIGEDRYQNILKNADNILIKESIN